MKASNITKEEVGMIKRAQAGDERAFNRIFKRYKPLVENILFRYLKDTDEARDLTNEVFLKVYEKLSMFKAYDSFGGWLRILTNNTAIDYLRSTNKSNTCFEPYENVLCSDYEKQTNGEEIINHMTYKQILELFNTFPAFKKEICLMYYQDRMPVKEISEILKVPTGTIKSVLSRTRTKIKKQLKI